MGKFQDKISTVMREYSKGELHSGGTGKIVKDKRQALAIAYSMARKGKK